MARGRESISLKKVAGRRQFTGSGDRDNLRGSGGVIEDTEKRQLVSRKSLGGGNLRGREGDLHQK